MGKYEALRRFLAKQSLDSVPMTFAEIERVIGQPLPASRRYPAWWSNNPSNNPMTKAWLAAGFTTGQVDVAGGKVVFQGVDEAVPAPPRKGRHPLFGCMKGTVTIMPGTTLDELGEE